MKVIMSIKPEFVEEIMRGTKKFEYRKRIFKRKVETIVIYSTYPVCKFIGEFKIGEVLNEDINTLWEKTSYYSGVSEEFYRKYFENYTSGYAIEIINFKKFENPIDPKRVLVNFKAPQSFCYLEGELCEK